MKFKMAAAAILNLLFSAILAKYLFSVTAVYISAKFHSSTSINDWVIAVCAKIQDVAAAAILDFIFV